MSSEGGLKSGGTISGDVTINGDLTVNGDGSGNYDDIVNGNIEISDTLRLNPTISSGSATTLAFMRSGTNKWRFIQPSDDSYLKLYNDQATATQMYFKSDGKIGINEESPDQKLHVSDTGDTPLKLEHTDGPAVHIELRNNAGAGYIGVENNDIKFNTTASGTERMRLASAGNLLLGLATAEALLDA